MEAEIQRQRQIMAQYDFRQDYVDFDVWVGGVIKWIPRVRYFGGRRVLFSNENLDEFFHHDFARLYNKAGGKALNFRVYYCLEGKTLDKGIRECIGDASIRELQREYRGKRVIPIYIVDWMEPIVAIDAQGKELNVSEQILVIGYVANPEINENTEINGDGPEMNGIDTEIPVEEYEINTKSPGKGLNEIKTSLKHMMIGQILLLLRTTTMKQMGGGDDEEESLSDSSLSDYPDWMLRTLKAHKMMTSLQRIENIIRDNPMEGLESLKNKIRRDVEAECSRGELYRAKKYALELVKAYVEIEKEETWKWFLNLLLRDIGSADEKGWAFISDRQKGLVEAVHSLTQTLEHRFCLKHMYNNFKAKYKGQDLKKLFWKAASTYNVKQHLRIMKEIERISPKIGKKETAYEWMCKISSNHWARCFFSSRTKCDALESERPPHHREHPLIGADNGFVSESGYYTETVEGLQTGHGSTPSDGLDGGNANNVETEAAAQEEEQAQTNIDPQFESETAEGTDEQTPMEFDIAPLFERPSYTEYTRHVEPVQFNSNVNATPLFQMHQQPSQTASSHANEGPRADVHLSTQASSVPNVHLPKPPRSRK
ncbi:hypothetical protein BUALT_Bualt10G0020700 [Buddleja alternifolia]|uniref:MULE transposase domain-containing protein n=1 Tax=Buddleja alternifolia TaxID=168488 RepID=A0AAV6WW87_9LAMI|nr:hypothetical protein BUALT_Bualt10G0020700 [Buddleja alternifolia]